MVQTGAHDVTTINAFVAGHGERTKVNIKRFTIVVPNIFIIFLNK